jgi:hypothetical protein
MPNEIQTLILAMLYTTRDNIESHIALVCFGLTCRTSLLLLQSFAFFPLDIEFDEDEYDDEDVLRIGKLMRSVARFIGPQYRRGNLLCSPFLLRSIYQEGVTLSLYPPLSWRFTPPEYELVKRCSDSRNFYYLSEKLGFSITPLPKPFGLGAQWDVIVLDRYKGFDYSRMSKKTYLRWRKVWRYTFFYRKFILYYKVAARLPFNGPPLESGWWALKK